MGSERKSIVEWMPSVTKGQPQPIDYSTLYDAFKNSPEINGIISAVIDDVLSDGYILLGNNSKVKRVNKYLDKINFFKVLKNAVYDLLITGDAYIEIQTVKERDIKRAINKVCKTLDINKFAKQNVLSGVSKIFKPFKLYNIDSATINIDFTPKGEIKNYYQEITTVGISGNADPDKPSGMIAADELVNFEKIIIPKENIIHFSYMNIGGRVYGFSPMQALANDLAALLFAKNYARTFFKNSGVPDWIFIIKGQNQSVIERNYEIMKKELRDMKMSQNKHKNLILTGVVEAKELNKFNKDLEFGKLIDMLTQRLLMAFRMPPARVSLPASSGDNNKQAFEGYYKSINALQIDIENVLNNQIFDNFDIVFKFKKSYKVDELREAQIVALLIQNGVMTQQEARDKIGLYGEIENSELQISKPTSNSESMPKLNTTRDLEDESKARPNDKRPPKPINPEKLMQIPTMKSGEFDVLTVDWVYFKTIVERFGEFTKQNILYIEEQDRFVLLFADKAHKYKTIVLKEDLDDVNEFRYNYLRNAIPFRLDNKETEAQNEREVELRQQETPQFDWGY